MVPDINNLVIPLKYFRRRRNLSVDRLAEISGVSPNTIAKIERGYLPRQDVIRRLSEKLGIPISELIVNKTEATRLEQGATDEKTTQAESLDDEELHIKVA